MTLRERAALTAATLRAQCAATAALTADCRHPVQAAGRCAWCARAL